MSEPSTELLVEIVGEAAALPPAEREAFVRRACPEGASRCEAMSLLRALERAGGFMDRPTVASAGGDADLAVLTEKPGDAVGRYTLLEPIGEGGFGVVFRAEQREPVRRSVALKIIKVGMDTRAVVARFEAERQALALMDHPCIAKVLDAGATGTGRPYFVMELVRGEPITAFCRARALPARERLGLFVQVCLAVQHAHTKGIIHRDLKPANILVAEVDGRPLPRIIDFGIAKATGLHAAGEAALTEARQFVGTPEYMSPEQARGPGAGLDTRTDIYSLGALLYELLTGDTPLEGARLRSAAWDQMLRMIREVDPPRPSTRLASAPGTSGGGAPGRGSAGALRGDLDWIVMRCLEKDPARRYQTAEGLAADIRRHLSGQAVLAAPPSRVYQVRKFVGRHRAGAIAAGVAGLSLLAGLSAALWEARVAARERDAAEARRQETELVSEFQASQLRDVDPQLMGARLGEDLLAAIRPGPDAEGRRARLAELLVSVNLTDAALRALDRNVFTRAIAAIDERFADRPAIRADLLLTVGQTMLELGLLEGAEAPLSAALALRREVLDPNDPATLRAEAAMGELLLRRGRLAEAQDQLGRTLERSRRALGDDDPLTLGLLSSTGVVRYHRGKIVEAEAVFREVLEKRRVLCSPDDRALLTAMSNVGLALNAQGKHGEAESFFRAAVGGLRRTRGEDHRDTLRVQSNLATALRNQGKYDEAETLVGETLARRRALLGSAHPETLNSCFILAQIHLRRGNKADLPEADALVGEALEGRRRVLGPIHDDTLESLDQLGRLRVAQSRFPEAELAYRELIAALESRGAGTRPLALIARLGLGRVLTALARYSEAEATLLDASRTLAAGHAGSGAGRGPSGQDPCAEDLVRLYTAWDAAEPGRGYDAKAAEWQAVLAGPPASGKGP